MNQISRLTVEAPTLLLDARNFDVEAPKLILKLSQAKLVGVDLETEDSKRHQGLSDFMGCNEAGQKAGNRPLVFDVRRTTICGFSLFVDGDDVAVYVNLAHADEENRVPWEKARQLLDAVPSTACFVAHNAEFERTMLRNSLGYEFGPPVICTLQMAVSAYGSDEYDPADFRQLDLGPVRSLLAEAGTAFMTYDGKTLNGPQGQIFSKFVGKESDAAHSFNGWVKTIARPYGLKQAVRYWFDHEMQTFEQTLNGNVHMGQLTGEQTAAYGASDSFWAVKLYHRMLQYMLETNPAVVETYFKQELPMVEYFSDIHSKGMRLNLPAVIERRLSERVDYAATLRRMRAAIRALLPFPVELHADLAEREAWYANGGARYRNMLTNWANLPDEADDYFESQRVSGPISNAWATDNAGVALPKPDEVLALEQLEAAQASLVEEKAQAELAYKVARVAWKAAEKGSIEKDTLKNALEEAKVLRDFTALKAVRAPNLKAVKAAAQEAQERPSITHYRPARVMLYDLLRTKVITDKGKVQSDGEARGKLADRLSDQIKANTENRLKQGLELLACMSELASTEQRAKLYLNPYLQLIDPETSRVYPVVSSKLASRRTAIAHPNGQQLAKRGESTYVRGFYQADDDDHVILSEDWSGIELVLIGELSGDPEFKKAFGQLPYADLHLGAAASCLSVLWGEEVAAKLDIADPVDAMEALLKKLKKASEEEIMDLFPKILTNIKGAHMQPGAALKFWRGTDCGKGANFNYWYSGALSDVGQRLGWTSDQMWKATEKYRERFAVAEKWRTDTIALVKDNGFIQLPDGHRRVRYEATPEWKNAFMSKFLMNTHPGVEKFAEAAARKIQGRANNQAVNSLIQGTCATMMKRSIIRMKAAIKAKGWTDRECRLLIPIHDEMLLSVHRDLVVEAIEMVREAMCYPDIVKTLPLTVAPAIGRTFEPYKKGSRMGQIELAELSKVPCVGEDRWDKEATPDEIRTIVNWMFEEAA